MTQAHKHPLIRHRGLLPMRFAILIITAFAASSNANAQTLFADQLGAALMGVREILVVIVAILLLIFGLMLSHAEKIGLPFKLVFNNKLKLSNILVPRWIRQPRKIKKPSDQLIDHLHHDLRNSLNSMTGLTTLLRKTNLDETQKDYIEALYHSVQTMSAFLNTALHYNQGHSDEIILKNAPFSPYDEICTVLKQTIAEIDAKNLIIGFAAAPLTVTIRGDNIRFRQIVLNLVGNAIKFTQTGGIEIYLHILHRVTMPLHDATLRLIVKDTGIGISDTDKRRLMLENSSPEAQQDDPQGLGLDICKKLVTAMSGSIYCSSQPGIGTSFEFDIPFLIVPPLRGEPLVDQDPADTRFMSGKKILIIAASSIHRAVLQKQIHFLGGSCTTISSGLEALGLIDGSMPDTKHPDNPSFDRYDAIIIAGTVYHTDGFTLLMALRREEKLKDLKIIVAPPYRSSNMMQMLPAYCDAIFDTPLHTSNMIEILRSVFMPENIRKEPILPPPVRRSRPLQILVVDDIVINRKLIHAALSHAGHSVAEVGDGWAALQAVSSQHYDVILMDIEMPPPNGIATTGLIRAQGNQNALIPIIAITGHDVDSYRSYCTWRGLNDCISKPINTDDLLECVEKWGYNTVAAPS